MSLKRRDDRLVRRSAGVTSNWRRSEIMRSFLSLVPVFGVVLSVAGPGAVMAQSNTPFVPSDFSVPEKLETPEFRLRMLTVNDVVKDYDAVMTSVDHLRGVFGPHSTWPQRRSSFAYTVMDPTESTCLGCVYIDPTTKRGYDAEVFLWVRKSEFDKGLDPKLLLAVKEWVAEKWPFKKVAYPGRDIDWEEWEALPER
jgi:hypothetical protein